MRKKSFVSVLLILLSGSVLLCGTVLALMFRQTDLQQNQFQAAEVSCVVHEKMDGSGDYTEGTVTGENKTSIQVENTGNIDAYIRLRLVSYWVNTNNEIIGKTSVMPDIHITDSWVEGPDNSYYCKTPVAPDGFTPEFLAAPITLDADLTHGHYQVVEVFAEAIQSLPISAVEDSWKVQIVEGGELSMLQAT